VAYGTVEKVEKNVKETLEIMISGGGYCFAPAHQLQENSPAENIVAMYRAAHTYNTGSKEQFFAPKR
jgi:uroporphyrinogen-III decarboxylase